MSNSKVKHTQKPVISLLKTIILLLFSILSVSVESQTLLSTNILANSAYASGLSSDSLTDSQQQDEFLPVEQAYQLNIEVEQDQLVLIWQIAEEYYLYGHRFKFELSADGKPIPTNPALPPGKKKIDDYFGEVEVFYHQVLVTIPLSVRADNLHLQVSSQGCADAGLCYPPYNQSFNIDHQRLVATEQKGTNTAQTIEIPNLAEQNELKDTSLLYILLLAAIGGAILNLMPCVFPVLTLKVLSFTGKDPAQAHTRMHGLIYTAGVVLSFVAVAAILLLLKAGGAAIGWGFHLQSPWFVAALTYLFFVMGLALSGMLEIGNRFMGLGNSLAGQSGYTGTFFTGVLATVVASPCTAPFMGTALGYAMTQPPVIALSVFAALGFGMALPFLILSEMPSLTRFMPQPGPWMDSFKRFMAFPLYATCVWLLWVIGNQTDASGMGLVLLGCLLIAMAIYLWHEKAKKQRWQQLKNITSIVATVIAFMFLASPFLEPKLQVTDSTQHKDWEPYSAERLQELQETEDAVFLNVTADWCITCLANESMTLSSEEIKDAFNQHQIRYLKADWTNHDPAITKLINQYGRSGIPLYLLYPKDKKLPAIILPQILTKEIVVNALEKI